MSTATLTGTQKAAVLLLQMGKDRSAKVLRSMQESEVAAIMAEVARFKTVKPEVADSVLDEFAAIAQTKTGITAGGLELARELLDASVGEQRAGEILGMVAAGLVEKPFEFMRKADPRQVLSFIQDEHPQTIAVVLAHMQSELAAMVMGGLDEELQRDVARRLAVMDRIAPDVLDHVEDILRRKLSAVLGPTEASAAGGVQSLVDILNRSDRATERLILEGLDTEDPELADEVRQRMFVFEDITSLDDRGVQLVLRQVDTKDLAIALKGVKADVRDKIMRNLSERAASNLAEEIDLLGPQRIKVVEEAQGGIVRVIRALEESGQLMLSRDNDEFVE
jgi:flagellar motor switch protein FliG